MRFLKTDDPRAVEETAAALLAGGVAAIPTDTVYGLAAHPGRPEAVERLYSIKGRDRRKPIALLADCAGSVERFGAVLSGAAADLARAHWPGALTLVLPCGGGFEGFRVPDCAFARELAAACGGVLRVTSANLSGCAAAQDAPAALAAVGLSCDIVADGGPARAGVASTVVRFASAGAPPEVLRQGPVAV